MAYRVQTAARVLDLSERVVWELVRRGDIQSFKVGTARLISRAALQKFIDGQGGAA
jgi:excisionase family DNA binding protein